MVHRPSGSVRGAGAAPKTATMLLVGQEVRNFTRNRQFEIEFHNPGQQPKKLWVRFIPDQPTATQPNKPTATQYVQSIQTVSSVKLGDLIAFAVNLTGVAGSDQTLYWKMNRANRFRNAPGSPSPYKANQNYNKLTIPQGESSAQIIVRVGTRSTYKGTSQLHTWIGQRGSNAQPYFKSISFRVIDD